MVEEGGYGDQVTVQYGPTAVQWCSTPLLEAIARASADTGRPVHMHLLETRYQRDWADAVHPRGIVRFLDDIGLLSPRLTLAHCAWARPEELALIAERGATIAVNTEFEPRPQVRHRAGAGDAEARLPRRDGPGWHGLRRGRRCAARDAAGLRAASRLGLRHDDDARSSCGTLPCNGPRSVRGGRAASPGRIAPAAPADLVLLDWDALDNDASVPDVDPLDLLLARANGKPHREGARRRARRGRWRPRAGHRRGGHACRVAGPHAPRAGRGRPATRRGGRRSRRWRKTADRSTAPIVSGVAVSWKCAAVGAGRVISRRWCRT